MSDTPKFEVIDRRKIKAEEEKQESGQAKSPEPPSPPSSSEPHPGPRLVVNEPHGEGDGEQPVSTGQENPEAAGEMPPAPTAEESHQQKAAYDASAQRLEDLIRAQNPTLGPPPALNFESLVQQFYLTAMLQMGAGTQEGQRPRVDIMGARATIDLLGIIAEKTRGNLSPAEDRMLQSALYEARMAFLELSSMVSVPTVPPPPPEKK